MSQTIIIAAIPNPVLSLFKRIPRGYVYLLILRIMGNGNAEKVKAEKGTKYRVWNTSL